MGDEHFSPKMISSVSRNHNGVAWFDAVKVMWNWRASQGVSDHQPFINGLSMLTTEKRPELHIAGPLWWESTSDRCIPLTMGQLCLKRFHIMTSSLLGSYHCLFVVFNSSAPVSSCFIADRDLMFKQDDSPDAHTYYAWQIGVVYCKSHKGI